MQNGCKTFDVVKTIHDTLLDLVVVLSGKVKSRYVYLVSSDWELKHFSARNFEHIALLGLY